MTPTVPPVPLAGRDAALTDAAALLLRRAGCEDLARGVSICWNRRLTSTAGLAKPSQTLVLLNPRLTAFPDEVERTLRHELAHLVAFARARGRRIAPHGREWRQACEELGIAGEARCHTLPLGTRRMARPYVYQCPACDYTMRRVRPINRRKRRLACRDCCRRHAGGRFDARFEFARVTDESVR